MIARRPDLLRTEGGRLALLALFLSAVFQFLCFLRWPGAPMFDLGYSILAAQNLVSDGRLVSLNMLADYRDDLAQAAHMRFLVHFPPGQSLLYAAAMATGLSPGAATRLLIVLGMLLGGAGWAVLARYLKASPIWLILTALIYPWLPFTGSAYFRYETEHVAGALMPWFVLALLRVAPMTSAAITPTRHLDARRVPVQRFAIVAALALLLVLFKYSMAPVFLGAAMFFLWGDGRGFIRRPLWWQIAIGGLCVAPLLLGLLVSLAYGPRLTVDGPTHAFPAGSFLVDSLMNSISGPTGWSTLLQRFRGPLGTLGVSAMKLVATLAVIGAMLLHLRARPLHGRLRRYTVLLLCLTASLWLGLAASSIAGKGQWNFASDARLYQPVVSMWLLFAIVVFARTGGKELLRSSAFLLCAVPVLLFAMFLLKDALVRSPHPEMPQSAIAWTESRDPAHANFLADFAGSRGHRPDLMIGPTALMNEIRVPSMSNGYFVPPGHHYWSSRPVEVWALVLPSQREKLLGSFAGHPVERVDTPAGYPFEFYIFTLDPR